MQEGLSCSYQLIYPLWLLILKFSEFAHVVDAVVMQDFRSRTRQALQEAGESETYKLVTQFLKVRDPLLYWPAPAHSAHLASSPGSGQSAALTLKGLSGAVNMINATSRQQQQIIFRINAFHIICLCEYKHLLLVYLLMTQSKFQVHSFLFTWLFNINSLSIFLKLNQIQLQQSVLFI